MSLPYQRFRVIHVATGREVGSVEAQTGEEAVYRLMGGEYGRTDYRHEVVTDRT